ncbi:MAG TPA: hypothetical protein VFG28_11965 [Syntrophales bacterium]|nr:hypothetical protein [Syntrophales bacterium]
MRRNVYPVILLGALWLILAACTAGVDESKPDDALSRYVSAYVNGNYEDAYPFLSSEDRASKSLEAYVAERKDSGAFLTSNLYRLIGYSVREVTLIDEMHARGTVDISIPDFRAIVKEISGALDTADYPDSALENVSFVRRNVGVFEHKYQTQGIPKRVLQQTFDLVKEGSQWKVRAGWGLKVPERR